MTGSEYWAAIKDFRYYPVFAFEGGLMYPTLGLAGEAGEVAEKVKKIIRDKSGKLNATDAEAIKLELGDVLFYITCLAATIGTDLDDVMQGNIDKLTSRKARGMLGGSGDNR